MAKPSQEVAPAFNLICEQMAKSVVPYPSIDEAKNIERLWQPDHATIIAILTRKRAHYYAKLSRSLDS